MKSAKEEILKRDCFKQENREYPKVCVNLQTDQFGGLFYGKEKGFPTKSSPSRNDGQLLERKQY